MAHKTLTISEEAYKALTRIKREGESFTQLVLRLVPRHTARDLLEYIEGQEPDHDLADSIEQVYRSRGLAHLRGVEFE
ncbi:MAG: antitoxin VapB family protein [Thermoplasmata archaeon]